MAEILNSAIAASDGVFSQPILVSSSAFSGWDDILLNRKSMQNFFRQLKNTIAASTSSLPKPE